jgi:hypothetical protein
MVVRREGASCINALRLYMNYFMGKGTLAPNFPELMKDQLRQARSDASATGAPAVPTPLTPFLAWLTTLRLSHQTHAKAVT